MECGKLVGANLQPIHTHPHTHTHTHLDVPTNLLYPYNWVVGWTGSGYECM